MIAKKLNSFVSNKGDKAKMIKDLGIRSNTIYDFLAGKTTKIGIETLEMILEYLQIELIQKKHE